MGNYEYDTATTMWQLSLPIPRFPTRPLRPKNLRERAQNTPEKRRAEISYVRVRDAKKRLKNAASERDKKRYKNKDLKATSANASLARVCGKVPANASLDKDTGRLAWKPSQCSVTAKTK